MDGNALATIAPYAWIVISWFVFAKWRPPKHAAWNTMAGFLFLPEGRFIAIPGLPNIDKARLTAILLLTYFAIRTPKGFIKNRPLPKPISLLFWLLAFANALTVLTNTDDLRYGPAVIGGLGLADLRIGGLGTVFDTMVPFWVGYLAYRSPDELRELARTMFWFALAYTPLALIERMKGPVMHLGLYGYSQHDFFQTIRSGGFRPMVFTSHGITLAKFFAAAIFLGIALSKLGGKRSTMLSKLRMWYLAGVLSISNSLGALTYIVVFGPAQLLAPIRVQLLCAKILAGAIIVVPVLRYTQIFPVTEVVQNIAEQYPERASSLAFRFMNEDILMEKALLRPWFGWGGNARARVITAEGVDISITDGDWILVLGAGGIIGFLAFFAPAVWSVFKAAKECRKMSNKDDQLVIAGMCLALGMFLADMIPNSAAGLPTFFLCGALAGAVARQPRGDVSGQLAT